MHMGILSMRKFVSSCKFVKNENVLYRHSKPLWDRFLESNYTECFNLNSRGVINTIKNTNSMRKLT